jgi:tetratricopeptide (TPR) repeat protein
MKNSLARCLLLLLVIVCLYSSICAKDEWTQVRSKNFFLIGNASDKDIRKVATRLEQFRETFQLLFKGINLVSPIATNVIVFKSDSSYRPFKPKRADGKLDNFVAGYFQPGEDVNYISLAVGGDDVETYRTIFHEYVHFIVNTNFGKSEVPPWFNEGLAEFYSTFTIENDQVVKLGLLIQYHLDLLRQTKMIPLDQLFAIGNRQLLNTGDHSRTIFYAESWALIHFLVQGGKGPALNSFLGAVIKGVPHDKAFKDAFGQDYASMQKQLEAYVGQSKYQGTQVSFEKKLTFDDEMQVTPLSAAMTNTYLGDLLYHANRADDAEPYLTTALKDDGTITMASADLGMVKYRQRKFDEARSFLETATKGEQTNAYALYYYAYLLSREGHDDYGLRREYTAETSSKMRDALRRAIAAEPAFTPSYELLAFIDVSTHTSLDEAEKAMTTAVKYEPGNEQYTLRLAEVYVDEQKVESARKVLGKLSHSSDNEIQERSAQLLQELDARAKYEQQKAEFEQRQQANGGGSTVALRRDKPISEEEVARATKAAELQSINHALRSPQTGEKRFVGAVVRIDCSRRPIAFTVRNGGDNFVLTSADFNSVTLQAFDKDTSGLQVGCEAKLAPFTAVISYKEGAPTLNNKGARGEIVAIEFVPDDFQLLSAAETADDEHPRLVRRTGAGNDTPPSSKSGRETEQDQQSQSAPNDRQSEHRDAIRQAMRSALRKPAEGEKREVAFLDKIDCGSKGNFFVFHNAAGTLRLVNDKPENLHITMFTRDLEGLQIGCTLKPVEYPGVIVYKVSADPKSKIQGTILSIEFMPKDFTLE